MSNDEFLTLFDLSHLSDIEHLEFKNLLLEFRDIFALHQCELVGSNSFEIDIPTNGQVVNKKQYQLTPDKEKIVEDFVQESLASGLIEPSLSPYNSPCHVVKKRNNEFRVVQDMREINAITYNYDYNIPNCRDMLRSLGGKKYYTCLDLKSGYMQIKLRPEDREKTAFTSLSGKYQFIFTPFGFKNVPFQFQYFMTTKVWKEMAYKEVWPFFDDSGTGHDEFDYHIDIVRKMFVKLHEASIKLRPDKCQFGVPKINFLGHEISKSGIHIDKSKVMKAKEFQPPNNKKQLMRFLGFMNYFHMFIKDFAGIAQPLFKLTSKDVAFKWSDVHQNAWLRLLNCLFEEPVLAHVDHNKQFIVQCDASSSSVGAVILQPDCNNVLKPVLYFSKKLNLAQSKWSATDRELYAIYLTLLYNKKLLWGSNFVIESDHKPLLGLIQKRVPERDILGKLARWLSFIQAFTFQLRYKKGSDNMLADFFSRDVVCFADSNDNNMYLSLDDIRISQESSPEVKNLKKYLLHNSVIPLPTFWDRCKERLVLDDDFVKFVDTSKYLSSPKLKYILPDEAALKVMKAIHISMFSNHCSAQNLQAAFLNTFYNPFVNKLAVQVLSECGICNATRRANEIVPPLKPLDIPEKFACWSLDFGGPFHTSNNGFKYILILTEHFTRWTVAKATKDQSSESVCDVLCEEILSKFGLPNKIINDNGSGLVSQAIKHFYDKLGIRMTNSTIHNPRSNGLAESSIKNVKDCLRKIVQLSPLEWDTYLSHFMTSYNTMPQSSTDISPYLAMFNVEPKKPWDILLNKKVCSNYQLGMSSTGYMNLQIQTMKRVHDVVMSNQIISKSKQLHYFDDKANLAKVKLHDIVFVRNLDFKVGLSKKLQPIWVKPSRVLDINDNYALIQDPVTCKKTKISVKHLKPSNYVAAVDYITNTLKKDVNPKCADSNQCFSTVGNIPNLPKSEVNYKGFQYYQIFDTAASVSIISKSLYDHFKSYKLVLEEDTCCSNICGLKNENVSLNIKVCIPVKFGKITLNCWFSVVNIESPLMLLGVNILKELKVINFTYENDKLVVRLPHMNTEVNHYY